MRQSPSIADGATTHLSFTVFASYSTEPDYELVRSVRSFLEGFHRSPGISGLRVDPISVCVDGTSFRLIDGLQGGSAQTLLAIDSIIRENLARSQYLLVFCCPQSAKSVYVAKEIQWFLEFHNDDNVLIAVTLGADPQAAPQEIFPNLIIERGLHLKPWYDFRQARRFTTWGSSKVRDFTDERLRLIGDLAGRREDLLPFWHRLQRRRQAAWRTSAVLLSLVLIALIVYSVRMRSHAATLAISDLSRQLAEESTIAWGEGSSAYERSTLLAIESTRLAPSVANDIELRQSISLLPKPVRSLAFEEPIQALAYGPRDDLLAVSHGQSVTLVNGGTSKAVATLDRDVKVQALAFSPDGKALVLGTGEETTPRVGELRVLNPSNSTDAFRVSFAGPVVCVAFSPNGNYVAGGSDDGTARVYDTHTGKEVARVTRDEYGSGFMSALAFSPDSSLLATLGNNGFGSLLDITKKRLVRLDDETDRAGAIAFSPDGQIVVSGGRTLRLFDIKRHAVLAKWPLGGYLSSIAISGDKKFVSAGLTDGSVHTIEISTLSEVSRTTFSENVVSLAFLSDGRTEIARSDDGTVRVFEFRTGKELVRSYVGATEHRHELKFADAPDSQHIAVGDSGGAVRIFETTNTSTFTRLQSPYITHLAFSLDGRFVIAGTEFDTARLFDVATGACILRLGGQGTVDTVTISSDSRLLALGNREHTARVIDIKTQKVLSQVDLRDGVRAIAFSYDNRLVAAASSGVVEVFEATSGREVRSIFPTRPMSGSVLVLGVAFSPDGRYLATATDGAGVGIWDIGNGVEVRHLRGLETVSAVTFSSDGRFVISGGDDGIALVSAADSGLEVSRLSFRAGITAVAMAADGRRVAAGSRDGSLRIFSTNTGQEVSRVYQSDTGSLLFNVDGRSLMAISSDGAIDRYSIRPQDLADEACARLSRNLTDAEWQEYVKLTPFHKVCPNLP